MATRAAVENSHLWAIGYDEMDRAGQVRDRITALGWDERRLALLDIAVVVRHSDGSFELDREPFPVAANVGGATAVGFIAGLVLGVPTVGAAVGALLGGIGTGIATARLGIDDEFVREVEAMMKPRTSALFVLDDEGDMDIILREIRGLGGTVLKTNVDVDRAKLIQSTLAGSRDG